MSEFMKVDGNARFRVMGQHVPFRHMLPAGEKECKGEDCPMCSAMGKDALKHPVKKRMYMVADKSNGSLNQMVLGEDQSQALDKAISNMDRLNRIGEPVLIVAYSLAFIGFLAGFMLALTHGIQGGDWGYMAIFIPISILGAVAVAKMHKQLRRVQRGDYTLKALGATLK